MQIPTLGFRGAHCFESISLTMTKPRSFAPPPGTILKVSISRPIHGNIPYISREIVVLDDNSPNARMYDPSSIEKGGGTAPMMARAE
ncbi:uncharacterized protein BDZ83DRAFT_275556 [Colletotrichum acutatum]|uniref:Uncharacterized protein n=1 Tax=Glomerella acutata TaxID=27357 RepID=A0AAD8XFL1_GLOAC|nr:uncharacterized protein BDZ83DRAFT_275556 [Colletotrichum acutatum]KAK1725999.1 hypothetical protein BDZ83DRAFT_275556 [Colletotrichum acutatum]